MVKANKALARMKEAGGGGPEGARMIGARKLRNGGVVYELSDPEAAKWLRQESAAFAVNFRGRSVLKERAVAIIIEFVLISYNPDVLAEIQKIECDYRLEAGAIVSTRWIKLVQRRADRQWTAHLITRLKMPEDVNRAIRNGLIVAGKRVWARRMRREPSVKNRFSDPTKEQKGRDLPRKDVGNRCQVRALREGCHERRKAQVGVSSREKKNTNRNLARATTKSKSRMQTVSNGCVS